MQKGLISIIVPVYNSEPYLEECMKSIMNQTYTNLEIILVNDGSTDKSGELCDIYAKSDDRVRVVHKENGGVCSARNAGLDVAQGEFVGFVDHDDTVETNMYEIMYERIIEAGADICICGVTMFMYGYTYATKLPEGGVHTPSSIVELYLSSRHIVGPLFAVTNKLILNNLLKGEKGQTQSNPIRFKEDLYAGEDFWFMADCYSVITKPPTLITIVDIPLFNHMYRSNSGSISKGFTVGDMDEMYSRLKNTMINILPQRKAEISSAIDQMECEYVVSCGHRIIIAGQEPNFRLPLNKILSSTSRLKTKVSALLMYLRLFSFYRLLYKIFRKR